VTAATWTQVLDDFAARLAAQRAALNAGEIEAIVAFVPPDDTGPLPVELAERARGLLAEAADLERSLLAQRDQTGREIDLLAHVASSTAPPRPSFVDHHA
jgi:hypothetical protein